MLPPTSALRPNFPLLASLCVGSGLCLLRLAGDTWLVTNHLPGNKTQRERIGERERAMVRILSKQTARAVRKRRVYEREMCRESQQPRVRKSEECINRQVVSIRRAQRTRARESNSEKSKGDRKRRRTKKRD